MAEPGGILVSGTAYDHVRNKVEVRLRRSRPAEAEEHRRAGARLSRRDRRAACGRRNCRRTDKPSIAVLPFTNMSGDPEQEYFADGITEDIITELSRFRSLFVIARNSSFHLQREGA